MAAWNSEILRSYGSRLKPLRLSFLFFLTCGLGFACSFLYLLHGRTGFERLTVKLEGKRAGPRTPQRPLLECGVFLTFSEEGVVSLHSPHRVEMKMDFDRAKAERALFQYESLKNRTKLKDLLYQYSSFNVFGDEVDFGAKFSAKLPSKLDSLKLFLGLEELLSEPIYLEEVRANFFTQLIESIPPAGRIRLSNRVETLDLVEPVVTEWLRDPRFGKRRERALDLCHPLPWEEELRVTSPDGKIDAVVVSRTGLFFGDPYSDNPPVKQTNAYLVPRGQTIEAEEPFPRGEIWEHIEETKKVAFLITMGAERVSCEWEDSGVVYLDVKNPEFTISESS